MIIIDQVAETTLAKTLDKFLTQPESARALYFNLKDGASSFLDGISVKVIAAAKQLITALDAQIYLCEDGDIFILAPNLPVKDAKKIMLAIGEFIQRPVDDSWVSLHELPQHALTLLGIVNNKLETRRSEEVASHKKQEEQQKNRKREAILNSIVTSTGSDIAQRRKTRQEAEFMIIEDDSFSRRLVENVIAKKFKLTGLGEATDALNTYARLAPDILFLDINLPDVTGHELLEKIVALDPNSYVVMLSGNADKDNIMHAMQLGAKGFIAKPFTREKLFQYIDRCPSLNTKPQHGAVQ